MVGLGMNLAADPLPDANIEDTLIYASEIAMLEDDLRVLGLLMLWLDVHHAHVNADRLVRVLPRHQAPRVRALWASIAQWLSHDRRLSRLRGAYEGSSLELLPVGTAFQLERKGEDDRFVGSALLVTAGTLRQRASDVLSRVELARIHAGYRTRVLMGPSWRADVWAALEADPSLTAAEAARRAYCSFATAWQVKRDFEVLREAS